eukprot:TRINITY_DN4845_c0_g1_i1.p1 TRINITY_DN4845_c0_g1~~TRINITY_DN4845_c0_g1_i1.p1  ORF type:complete len:528 (+),score=114.16 TRINITY_DN4845_c0_g1_i1:49-1632(+)
MKRSTSEKKVKKKDRKSRARPKKSAKTPRGTSKTRDITEENNFITKVDYEKELILAKEIIQKQESIIIEKDSQIAVLKQTITKLEGSTDSEGALVSPGRKKITSPVKTAKLKEKIKPVPLTYVNLRRGKQKDAFTDLVVETANGSLPCHAVVVAGRCSKISEMLQAAGSKKKKSKRKPLAFKKIQAETMMRVLDYLYVDDIFDKTKMKASDWLKLLLGARILELDSLVWMCEDYLLSSMSLDNIVELLSESHKMGDERIRTFCFNWLLLPDNFKEFVTNAEAPKQLGMDLFTQLITANVQNGPTKPNQKGDRGSGKHVVADIGPEPKKSLKMQMMQQYKDMPYSDSLVVIEGEVIQFHKAVLASASATLWENLKKSKGSTSKGLEDLTECLELGKGQKYWEKISADAFKSLLKFVYYGELNMEALSACLMIPFSQDTGISSFQKVCELTIEHSVGDAEVVLKILAVTYLEVMQQREGDSTLRLRKDSITQTLNHLATVDLSEIKRMDPRFALDLSVDLLLAIQKNFT